MSKQSPSTNRKAKKKKPAKRFQMLGRSVIDRLYRAVLNYVESREGSLIVIGGVEVQHWRGEPPSNFKIAVRCTGKPPAIVEKP